MGPDGLELEPWENPHGSTEQERPEAPARALARTALLADYVNRLREDPGVRRASSHPGFGHAFTWAADELEHVASTLFDARDEDARYEMDRVLDEVREKLSLLVAAPLEVVG